MKYALMHKTYPVLDMELEESGYILKILDVYDEPRIPVGVHVHNSGIDRKALNDWWQGRRIPASRMGLDEALLSIGISSPVYLLEKCYGLSLSDQYWICPNDSGLTWESVNFFHNDFSDDMGKILFGNTPEDPDAVSLMSPDNTSDGWLRKKWIIADGKRLLMKGGSGVYQQEPFNEVIATAIMQRLGISHVPYTLTFDNSVPYSLCENFVTPNTDLVPAWRMYQSLKRSNDQSHRDHFITCCEALGGDGKLINDALNKMLTLDYIISNEDRHWNNFGVIRDIDSLQVLGLAPVFDSGTSLWCNTPHVGSTTPAKPFRDKHSEQIKLVKNFSWFNPDSLKGLYEEIIHTLTLSDRLDEMRCHKIAEAAIERAGHIDRLT